MSYPEIKIHLIVQIAVKPFLVCLLSLLSVCDSPRESYDGTPGSKIRQIGFLFQRITPFIEGAAWPSSKLASTQHRSPVLPLPLAEAAPCRPKFTPGWTKEIVVLQASVGE